MSGDETKATVVDRIAARAARQAGRRGEPVERLTLDALYDAIQQPAKDRLTCEGVIARGGMGAVELVVDSALQRRLALKAIHPELLQREEIVWLFVREARITAQLDHPNIVPVHDIGTNGDQGPFFTMKRVEGRTLAQLIAELPPKRLTREKLCEILDILVKVCDALAFAHSRGVLHCDLKPQNIMVGDFGQVYLMDWGIARVLDGMVPDVPLDGIGDIGASKVMGTAAYMSPEQASAASLDPRSDIFAMGAILYQVLARRAPYQAESFDSLLDLARRAEYAPPSEVIGPGVIPHALERIVLKAMELEPERRYPSVEVLQEDLVRFTRGGEDFPTTSYPAGAYIVREGERGDTAYIIAAGRCEVCRVIDGELHSVRVLGPGEVFGETAILTASARRTADVVALEDTSVHVVTRLELETELTEMKPWVASLMRTLAERFRRFAQDRRVTTAMATVTRPRRG